MMVTNKPLVALTAADLMSTALVMVPQEMSLQSAAHLLSQAEVTGAPVVNAEGRCVGVLSSTDFIHWAEKGPQRPAHTGVCSSWQIVEPDKLPREEVKNYMTADPVTVHPGTPVADLSRMMLDAHIHRVIVVDRNCRPVGIVSSTDILAAVAQSMPPVTPRCPHFQGLGSN
jgi:CBS-domain-containing membrane protein